MNEKDEVIKMNSMSLPSLLLASHPQTIFSYSNCYELINLLGVHASTYLDV